MTDRKWYVQIPKGMEIGRMPPGARKGRVLRDGYFRGVGLEFGNLSTLCRSDEQFLAAQAIASGRTIVSREKLMNLFMLLMLYVPRLESGNIVEFGSYKGGSALFMAYLASKSMPDAKVFSFDTFTGMPETDGAVDAHIAGNFDDTNVDSIRDYAQSVGLTNIEFIPGRFEETARPALARIGKIGLAHIDCDIHSAVTHTYDACKPHLVTGGYVVFDDPLCSNCMGAFEAVEDCVIARDGLRAEQVFPHLVFRYPPVKE